uniref:Uncharacterized protein n=1 Tax=Nothobranchius pienaari TaxID=704102 RepID=A0A1A8L6B1_9TELE
MSRAGVSTPLTKRSFSVCLQERALQLHQVSNQWVYYLRQMENAARRWMIATVW